MKRFLALLGLVLALVAGTAGLASATTIGFDAPPLTSPSLPYPTEINGITSMTWDATGWYGGHLWCTNFGYDSTISFTNPTYVNNFQMNGPSFMPPSGPPPEYIYGPMDIVALNAGGGQVWGTTVEFDEDHRDLGSIEAWLTVDVNTSNVSSIIFKSPNPSFDPDGFMFYPSIDNLVINVSAVPIPATAWLLASGLLPLAGLRRKVTR